MNAWWGSRVVRLVFHLGMACCAIWTNHRFPCLVVMVGDNSENCFPLNEGMTVDRTKRIGQDSKNTRLVPLVPTVFEIQPPSPVGAMLLAVLTVG
jgi:hypothetical protein